jgi:hypothetical protein
VDLDPLTIDTSWAHGLECLPCAFKVNTSKFIDDLDAVRIANHHRGGALIKIKSFNDNVTHIDRGLCRRTFWVRAGHSAQPRACHDGKGAACDETSSHRCMCRTAHPIARDLCQ